MSLKNLDQQKKKFNRKQALKNCLVCHLDQITPILKSLSILLIFYQGFHWSISKTIYVLFHKKTNFISLTKNSPKSMSLVPPL